MYRIALHVGNVDLEDPATDSRIAETDDLRDIGWESVNGRLLAVIYTNEDDPIGLVVQTARRIAHTLPGADVDKVDEDLVSISDIASRVGVTREAVRHWVKGTRGPANFPSSVGSVGGGDRGSTQVWSWPYVNRWLDKHYSLRDEDEYLSPEQVALVNAALLKVEDYMDHEWQEMVLLDLPLESQGGSGPPQHRTVVLPDDGDFVAAVELRLGRDA